MDGPPIDALGTGLAAVEAPRLGLQVGGVLLLVWGVYLGQRRPGSRSRRAPRA